MKPVQEIIKSSDYWLTAVQEELFRQLIEYKEKNNLTQKQIAAEMGVSPSYISQILNGNFNHTLMKFIELCLYIKKIPQINFVGFDEYLRQYYHPVEHKPLSNLQKVSDGQAIMFDEQELYAYRREPVTILKSKSSSKAKTFANQ